VPGQRIRPALPVQTHRLQLVEIRHKYAAPEDRILFAVAQNTQAILTLLEGAPVMARKAGDWA